MPVDLRSTPPGTLVRIDDPRYYQSYGKFAVVVGECCTMLYCHDVRLMVHYHLNPTELLRLDCSKITPITDVDEWRGRVQTHFPLAA